MTRNTKWTIGEQTFDLGPLPEYMARFTGVMPAAFAVDPDVGDEVLLNVFDGAITATALAALGRLDLHVAAGVVSLAGGPVAYLVFLVPNPGEDSEPFAAYEVTLNLHDPEHLEPFLALAEQSHWHVVVIGEGLAVLDVVEIENVYELGATLASFVGVAADYPCTDFAAAKAELEATYTLADLWNMAQG